jgi:hypothetical protein
MTDRRRRMPIGLVALVALVAYACDPAVVATSEPASRAPDIVAPTPGPSARVTTQTDTDWGRIWDGVPTGFPVYPGAGPTTPTSPDPVSATWAVEGGDALGIASWVQTSLETATYSTEAMSGPFEDGGFVIDSVGDGDCRIETRIAPQGGLTFISVRYGAACPID